MQSEANKNPEKWIALSEILAFNKMRAMGATQELVEEAVKGRTFKSFEICGDQIRHKGSTAGDM